MARREVGALGEGWPGKKIQEALAVGVRTVMQQEEELNRLNVFPIADRDTGSNLRRTLEAGLSVLDDRPRGADRVLAEFARASLINARGNSGVILAEILRGLAEVAQGEATFGPSMIAEGLNRAAEYAYQAVAEPVEGTILSAVKAAAAATGSIAHDTTMAGLWAMAASASHQATSESPKRLAILAQNHVVDAAALGFSYFLQGLAEAHAEWSNEPSEDGYEVQFLLTAELPRTAIQEGLAGLGTSLVVSGDRGLYRVHIHTFSVSRVLEVGRGFGGAVEQITVDRLDADGGHGPMGQEAR